MLRDHLNSLIRQRWDVNTVLTSPTDVEIGSPVADKGRALEWLSERLGIIKDQILAIGDNFNDLEMFRASGTAAAMGNAPQDVKYQAAFAAPSNEEDGVAAVLEQLI